jgi:cell wall-associated NlpC family hydrolase
MMRKAGFPENQIGIGLRIAHLESGLRPTVTHLNSNGSTDYGIFQLNSIHRDLWGAGNVSQLFDPQTNVNFAFKIFQQAGNSWKPWTTLAAAQRAGALAVPQTRLTGVPAQVGGAVATATGSVRNQVVNKAMIALNLPYAWGGNSLTTGVDCSGLVQQVYKMFGISTPRQARAQAAEGAVGHRVASVNQLQPGDLVAFQWAGGYAGPNTVSHIAIYAGNGQIIEEYGPDGTLGRRRALGNSTQDRGAIYIHVKFPGE